MSPKEIPLPAMTADEMVAMAYALITRAQKVYAAEHVKYRTEPGNTHAHSGVFAYAAMTRADALIDAQIILGTHWELD